MAKKAQNSLETAKEFASILLYEVTGGKLGEASATSMNIEFSDKRALLDSLIKLGTLELREEKSKEGEGLSAFDIIKQEKDKANGGKKDKRGTTEYTAAKFAELGNSSRANSSSDTDDGDDLV